MLAKQSLTCLLLAFLVLSVAQEDVHRGAAAGIACRFVGAEGRGEAPALQYTDKKCGCNKTNCGSASCGCRRKGLACIAACACGCDGCLNPSTYLEEERNAKMAAALAKNFARGKEAKKKAEEAMARRAESGLE